MKKATSSRFLNSIRLSLLAAGVFALAPASHAVDKIWTGGFYFGFGFPPIWDGASPTNWNPVGVPNLTDNAIFPAVIPPAAGGAAGAGANGLRTDGSEILIDSFGGNPVANNLTFLNSYKLSSKITAVGFGAATPTAVTPLRLNTGNVTVAESKIAILDITVNVLSGQLTKLGGGTLILGSGPNVVGALPAINANVLVQEGTFGGSGFVSGNLINQATVAPGNSPGTLHVGGNLQADQDRASAGRDRVGGQF